MGQRESTVSGRPHIVLGVSGGIAAYKAAELVRLLVRDDMDVRVVISRSAAYAAGWATTTRARSAGRSPS